MPVEERGNGDFAAAQILSDRFEGQRPGGFGVEEGLGGGREAVDEGCLEWSSG